MASINVRYNKLVVDFRYMGKRCRESTVLEDTPSNRRNLQKLLERMEAEITLGSFEYAKYFPKSPRAAELTLRKEKMVSMQSKVPKFSEFAGLWFEHKKIEWRDSYQVKMTVIIEKFLIPEFGTEALDCIKKSNLLDFRASLGKVTTQRNPAGLTTARINQIMTVLRSILHEAADRYGFESPYKNIKNLREDKVDVMPFTLEEVWHFINNVREDFRNYYRVRFFTGLRTSEIDGLRWCNVDLNRREIHIREALVDGKVSGTKTKTSSRTVQMNLVVYEALSAQKTKTYSRNGYVFCNRNGEPLDYRNVNRRIWTPTLAWLGLTHRRAYETRHTAATLWLASGENPEWVAKQLGHANTEMLFRIYSRFVPDVTRRDGSAFEQLLQASTQSRTKPARGH